MKTIHLTIFCSLLVTACLAQTNPTDSLYLGQIAPGDIPKVFKLQVSPGHFAAERIAISNDGRDIYYSQIKGYYPNTGESIKKYSFSGGKWTGPFIVFEGYAAPALSLTGDTMYIERNFETYLSAKKGSFWSNPKRILTKLDSAHYMQTTKSGNYYISSKPQNTIGVADWCKLNFTGSDTTAISLGKPLNTIGDNLDFFVARDESFIITTSRLGLSISFRTKDGTWCNPVNLGPEINFGLGMWGPYVTPDNKYLFYSTGTKPDYSDVNVYSVRIDNLIDSIRKTLSGSNEQRKGEDEFFVFEPDIRLFTSYAFMNAAGYSHDWNATMHPVRVEVRDYLDSILTDDYKKEIGEYYSKLGGGDFYGYGVYAINSEYPPAFGLICDSCKNEDIDKFVKYDSLLQNFYEKAHIGELWERYYGKLLEINLQYKPFAEIAIKQITAYCRVDSNYYRNTAKGKFHYQQIPLMSYFTAFFNESGNDYWVISGPSAGEPDPSAFYHEPLHKLINPIVESNSQANHKIEDLVGLAQERLKGDYNGNDAILCESFVRTIDRILYARYNKISESELRQIVEDEYKLGHILSFYLLENLPDYEAGNKTLQEYYPELIANINVEYEKSRWINYWKKQGEE